MLDPLPMLHMFDRQVEVRMEQANVRARTDELRGLISDDDPCDVEGFATHHPPLSEAPAVTSASRRRRTVS